MPQAKHGTGESARRFRRVAKPFALFFSEVGGACRMENVGIAFNPLGQPENPHFVTEWDPSV